MWPDLLKTRVGIRKWGTVASCQYKQRQNGAAVVMGLGARLQLESINQWNYETIFFHLLPSPPCLSPVIHLSLAPNGSTAPQAVVPNSGPWPFLAGCPHRVSIFGSVWVLSRLFNFRNLVVTSAPWRDLRWRTSGDGGWKRTEVGLFLFCCHLVTCVWDMFEIALRWLVRITWSSSMTS